MAFPNVRALGRSGFVALVCAFGCATGTQGDEPLGGDEGGSASTAGSFSDAGSGGSAPAPSAGTSAMAGSESFPFGGVPSGGTFGTSGTFSTSGTSAGGGGGNAGTASGGAAGAGGKAGSGGSAGMGGKGGAGTAGSGGKAGGCGSTQLTASGVTGTSENGALLPTLAIDGDMTSRWGSEHSEPQNLDLDLGEVVTVKRVLINWEAAYATNFELQVASNAGGPFTTVHTDAAGNGGNDDITLATASDGRYLRMRGVTRKTTYGFSIYEISVYGDKDETCQ